MSRKAASHRATPDALAAAAAGGLVSGGEGGEGDAHGRRVLARSELVGAESLGGGAGDGAARACGDRYIRPGEYQGMGEVLGFPCQVDLPPEAIDAAAEGLRANAVLLRALRLRLSDLETRMGDFTGNNREVFKALREVAGDAP